MRCDDRPYAEIAAGRQRGYVIVADCLAVYHAALVTSSPLTLACIVGSTVKDDRVESPWLRGHEMDVSTEMDALGLSDDPAWLAWRVTWLHALTDGNGRVGRAAAYGALLAADPALRATHIGRKGRCDEAVLTVPERMERNRSVYVLTHMNGLHEAHRRADTAAVHARLDALRGWLHGLAEDQKADRPSACDW